MSGVYRQNDERCQNYYTHHLVDRVVIKVGHSSAQSRLSIYPIYSPNKMSPILMTPCQFISITEPIQ